MERLVGGGGTGILGGSGDAVTSALREIVDDFGLGVVAAGEGGSLCGRVTITFLGGAGGVPLEGARVVIDVVVVAGRMVGVAVAVDIVPVGAT